MSQATCAGALVLKTDFPQFPCVVRTPSAVRQWRGVAKKYGITRDEQARMAPAFEHAGS
jgi:hypothetical protein